MKYFRLQLEPVAFDLSSYCQFSKVEGLSVVRHQHSSCLHYIQFNEIIYFLALSGCLSIYGTDIVYPMVSS